jgi:hypothetical protein
VHSSVGGVGHIEPFDQLVGPLPCSVAPHSPQPGKQNQVLPAGEHWIQRRILCGEPDVRADLIGLPDDVVAGHNCFARGRPQQRGQDFDHGRLTGAVVA